LSNASVRIALTSGPPDVSERANPSELERVAAQLDRGAAELEAAQRTVQASIDRTNWQGIAGDSLRADVQALQKKIDDARANLKTMAHIVRNGAAEMRDERNQAHHQPDRRNRSELVGVLRPQHAHDDVLVAQREDDLVLQHG